MVDKLPPPNPPKRVLTPEVSILIGAFMITLAILMHGGIIRVAGLSVGNNNASTGAAAAPNAPAPAKSLAQVSDELKNQAEKIGIDKSKFAACLDDGEKASLVLKDLQDGSTLGVGGTPSFFVNGRPLFIGASPFSEFKTVIDEELNGTAPSTTERVQIGAGDLPALGNANAPVTLVEFSDYECPFCARFYSGAMVDIKREYVDTGKVKFYYRDYPLSQIHPSAQKAAEAARCAGDQGKYWDMHNIIFENQTSIF